MVRRVIKKFVNFVRVVRHMPPPPDPGGGWRADAKEIREVARAVYSPGGPSAHTGGTGNTDKIVSKVIADTHKKTKH